MKRASKDEKGPALEELAKFLLDGCKLLKFEQRDYDHETGEIDLIYYVRALPGTYFQEWSSWLVVECKNWASSVGVEQIDHFGAQIKRGGQQVGLLFAVPGISGDRRHGVDGRAAIRWWRDSMDCRILGINENELDQLPDNRKFYSRLHELDLAAVYPPK